MNLVANARMYSATPSLRADWKDLLHWVLQRAELPWDVIDYDAPAPLNALWARDDLGLAMMCGLPFSQRGVRPTLVAAPIPSPSRYEGQARYCSDVVVRADAPYQRLEDTFGGTVGYTLVDSMSGGVNFRNHLAPYREARGARLYKAAVGNLIHARGVIEALVSGRIDVGPLDGYFHDLLRHADPAFASQVRVIASTQWLPIPPLVATAKLADADLARLRKVLTDVAGAEDLAPLRARLLLAGFAFPDASHYAVLDAMERSAIPAFEEI